MITRLFHQCNINKSNKHYNHMHIYQHKPHYQHHNWTTHFTCLTHHWSSHGNKTQTVSALGWYPFLVSLPECGSLISQLCKNMETRSNIYVKIWHSIKVSLPERGNAIPIHTPESQSQSTSSRSYICIMISWLYYSSTSVTTTRSILRHSYT